MSFFNKEIYFIGIGGIGMSALARYFKQNGARVSGFDRTETPLTTALQAEGIAVHYDENIAQIPTNPDWVIYTPAISNHSSSANQGKGQGSSLLRHCIDSNFEVIKRSEALGIITQNRFTIAVAGSHGKTSVTSMIAHILHHSGYGCTAFVGGIMKNYNSNYLSSRSDVVVVEADEYDRSFLRLHPDIALITAIDTDHLDIYQNIDFIKQAFAQFIALIKPQGALFISSQAEAMLQGQELAFGGQTAVLPVVELERFKRLPLFPKWQQWALHNRQNALSAASVARYLGVSLDAIVSALTCFEGIKRRFEYIIDSKKLIYIDDYAHHPEEIRTVLGSLRNLYPNWHITAIFQPHLYSRTQDLADEFAQSLDLADTVLLLDLYPAREEPIEGVSSKLIFDKMNNINKILCNKNTVLPTLATLPNIELVISIGAGDIDTLVQPIKEILEYEKA